MIRKVIIVAIQIACLVGAAAVCVTYAISQSVRVRLFAPEPVEWTAMFEEERHNIYVWAHDGHLKIGYRDKKRAPWQWSVIRGKSDRREFMQFVYYRYQSRLRRYARDHIDMLIPLWFLFIVFSAYPTIAFIRGPVRRWRVRRCERKGLCFKCGYNLTGNVSGVCPECGTEVETP